MLNPKFEIRNSRTYPKITPVNVLRVLSLRHPAVLVTCGRQGTRLRATRTKTLTRNFGISSKQIQNSNDQNLKENQQNCEGNSVVECQLPKLNVAGSIPVPRFSFLIFQGVNI